jgi:hypothetical protein
LKPLPHLLFFKFLITILFLTWCTNSLFSQNYNGGSNYNDAQFWQNIYIEKDLTQKFNFHVNEEGRITENMTLPSYIYADLGLTYKFKKYLRFTLAYVPIAKRLQTDFVSYNHQFYFDFVIKIKYHHFIFYERQMFQSQYGDINKSAIWNIPSYYLRNKITIKYKHRRYIPYVAAELYYHDNYNQYNGMQSDRMRYYAGCFYELNKLNQIELYYLIEPHYNIPASFTNYIIGVGYAHNLY